VLLVVVGPDRPRPTALLTPRFNGKPEADTAVVIAPDDGHEDVRNMLSCLVFKLSPCCNNDKLSSGYFPGV
jgi:hypothetical protein